MYEVLIEKTFSSAHFLRLYKGKDEPLHGHNWRVQVKFQGAKLVQPEEYLIDFAEAREILDKIIERIDYKNINEVPPFDRRNTSAENIAHWIYEEFAKVVPKSKPSCVTVWETEQGAASFIPNLGSGSEGA